MIYNATVSAITAPAAADKFGDATFPAPAAISIRANLQDVTERERQGLGDRIKESTAVLLVEKSRLGNLTPAKGYEVRVAADDGPLQVMVAEHVSSWTHGSQSHYEVFLKERR